MVMSDDWGKPIILQMDDGTCRTFCSAMVLCPRCDGFGFALRESRTVPMPMTGAPGPPVRPGPRGEDIGL